MSNEIIPASGGGTPASMRGLYNGLLQYGMAEDPIKAFRAAAPLPLNAQLLIDKAVIRVGLDRLVLAKALLTKGLTFPLPNWLSVPLLYWEQMSEVGGAIVTMTPKARGENQRPARTGKTLPIPCIMDDFNIGLRDLLAAERAGAPLDTTGIEMATRRVNEKIEDLLINGAVDENGNAVNVGGFPIYGLLTAPNKNTVVYGSGLAWDDVSKTGAQILADVLSMIASLQAARRFGPYILGIPTTYGNALNADFKAFSGMTILQRIQMLDQISDVLVADRLPANKTVLFQATSDIVEAVVGQEPTVVSWQDSPGFERYFVVLASIIPRVRDDSNAKSGVVVGYTS